MTYKEKLMHEHPECLSESYAGGCQGCPYDYGYEPKKEDRCKKTEYNCAKCWNREMPETAAEQPVAHYDPVSHPAHYTSGKIECIYAIEAAIASIDDPVSAFLTGQVLKYLWRWPLKGGVEDLRKAAWYLSRLIDAEGTECSGSR